MSTTEQQGTGTGTDAAGAGASGRPGGAVRHHAAPARVEVDATSNLTDLLAAAAEATADGAPLYRRRVGGAWHDVPGPVFLAEVRALAAGLVGSGVGPGDRVAIMARTRYEWSLTDAAIWWAGAVGVPVYETSSSEQARWILADSGAVAAVVETAAHRDLVEALRPGGGSGPSAGQGGRSDQADDGAGGLSALAHVWTIDAGDLDALAAPDGPGAGVEPEALEARRSAAVLADPATIIYTSGTTGRPKGCVLTHGNFAVLARSGVAGSPDVFAADGASTLLFLPLAHVFARYVQVLCWVKPVTVGHAPDVSDLTRDLAGFRPSFILAVPRVFEKVFNSAQAKAATAGPAKARVFAAAAATAEAFSRAQDASGPSLVLRARHALFDRLVYSKLRAALGGRTRHAVSGGAPLSERLGHFFRGAGITVLQGYGLTETTAPTAVNVPGAVRMATVGPPLPGCTVGISADGEVLVAGPHVSAGYWDSTAQAPVPLLVDGWFPTGDLGDLDEDGYLSITGRRKEIIVTAGGKNVAPAALEDPLRAHPLVSQAVVVGDGRPYVAALLTLDEEMLPTWLSTRSLPEMGVAAAAHHEDVLAELQRAVDAANARVSHAEAVKRFVVLDHDLTEAGGQLTPSLKVKRAVVLAEEAEQVEELYARARESR